MSTIKHKSTTNRKYPFIKLSVVCLFFILLILVGLLLTRKNKIITEQSSSHTIPVSENAVRPLLVGDSIPELELQTAGGKAFDLKQAVAKQLTVLIFYRGGWCPYCNLQLGQIQTIEMQLRQLGYQILAISPDRPEKLIESVNSHKLTYTLLSDHAMKAARAFGIAFRVDDATLEKYKGYGIDLEAASGETHHLLPVPAVFIVGTDGLIKFSHANPDYKVRLEPDVLLAAARAAVAIDEPKRSYQEGK
jgi:peroxiredoxin